MTDGWSNWSGTVRCTPQRRAAPADEAGVLAELARARETGACVRVAGSGHSHTPLCATDGVLLALDALDAVEPCGSRQDAVRVGAGITLHALGAALLERGRALENLGDVDVQALAGALATGTHGTGSRLRNLSSQVLGMRVATAEAEVVDWQAGRDDEWLRAARVGLGALGVVLSVDLRVLPAYRLHERTWRGPLEPVLEALDDHFAAHRHFEFFYFPKHDFAEAKAIDPTEAEPGAPGPGERVGWSAHILPSVREEKFFEMEYAVPAEAGPACFAAVRQRIRARHPTVTWPVEYRTVAADDAFLSPATERPTVTISVHQDGRFPYEAFFADVEPVFWEHDGRPHWGKVHSLDGGRLAARYPAWDRFVACRRRLDPEGHLLNEHLRGILEHEDPSF
ncbi:MAG: D-arabinono-1,4-lactone oxidase [Myxococcota bacterium]|nr:D-arabinono-1,4-lactone oxidase [Myxococcota bacterium]